MLSVDTGINVELRRSFVWRTLAAAAGMLSSFMLTVVAVRTLEAQEAATFFAILAALAIGPLIGRLGLGPNVIRLLPAEPDPTARRDIAGVHLRAAFVMSCLSAPLIALVGCNGLMGHSNFVPVLVLTAVLIAVESTRLMVSDIFAALGRVGASVATMHYVRSLLAFSFVSLVVLTVGRPSLVLVLTVYLAVSTVQLLLALVHARDDVAIVRLSSGIAAVRKVVGQGAQVFALEFSVFILLQGTIWIATAAFTPLVATQYAAAATLAMQVTVLESLAALAITPPIARLWAAGRRGQAVRTLSNVATLSTAIVMIVVVLLAIIGPAALQLAYGEAMRPASTILLILAISGVFQAAFNVNMSLLLISGHIRAAARAAIAIVVVAVPSAVAAAWLGGPIALAVVSSLSVAALSISQWATARRRFSPSPHAHHRPGLAMRELSKGPEAAPTDVAR